MKKILLILFALMLVLFCSCGTNEVHETPEDVSVPETLEQTESEAVAAEKVVVTIDGKDYEVFVPAKTRFEVYEGGQVEIITPSNSEMPVTVDLSGLSGCEYIKNIFVTLMSETESLIFPSLPNLISGEIHGNDPALLDLEASEGCERLYINVIPSELKIGKGPYNLELGYDFDLGMAAGCENVKMLMAHGDTDLSKVAEIGEVEEVYLVGGGADLKGLENLKSLKKLSFHYYDGDLSAAEYLTMETLAFENETTQESVDSFTYSETVFELQLNDKTMTNLDIFDKLPNLQMLLLIVDPIQTPEVPVRDEITDESQIDLLETNLPKEKLKAFFKKGGMIYIMDDWSRT